MKPLVWAVSIRASCLKARFLSIYMASRVSPVETWVKLWANQGPLDQMLNVALAHCINNVSKACVSLHCHPPGFSLP